MKVPFVDLSVQHCELEPELKAAFARVLERGSFILGPEVERFETAFAEYLDVAQAIALHSGTAALQLALQALGVGPGDEVITVANTFIATAEAISAVGARPVFVDIDPVSYTMDVARVESAITPKCRAIVPVHLYGQCADLDPLLEIARAHGLAVVEDACQAHGAEYKGQKAGTVGDIGCFSFYPSKNLGACGEGGAVVTRNAELARRIRLLRNHGSVSKYEHAFPGYNFRMEGIQGAILSVKLPHLDLWNQERRALAEEYGRRLRGSNVVPPVEMPYGRHVYHLYVVQVDDRDRVRGELARHGIETGLHYPLPLHLQEAYRSLGYRSGDLPVCERVAQRLLSLPMYPGLGAEAVEYVAAAILEVTECLTPATARTI